MSATRLNLHPRALRSNIWRVLLCASDLEIHEGMYFYEGAHGLCNLFAKIYRTTPSHVAGEQLRNENEFNLDCDLDLDPDTYPDSHPSLIADHKDDSIPF